MANLIEGNYIDEKFRQIGCVRVVKQLFFE